MLVLLMHFTFVAANCKLSDVMRINDIVASCCESQPGGTCADGFPATCSQACAEVLVPYWVECSELVNSLGDDTFPSFRIADLDSFVTPCQQTSALYQHALDSGCGGAEIVESLNAACCEQEGENVCAAGQGISKCDAECAGVSFRAEPTSWVQGVQLSSLFHSTHVHFPYKLPAVFLLRTTWTERNVSPQAFIPYWVRCILSDEQAHDVSDIREYQALHAVCTEQLPDEELAHLYAEVVAMVGSTVCTTAK